jgi:hypothetical protein
MRNTELPIAEPCNADWTTMTLADRGRFCGQCRKVVRELGQMTEVEARAMLASPPTEGLCVRYVHDATGEILFRPDVVPVARLARVRRAAAVALAAASLPLAVSGCMGAAPMPPPLMGSPPPPVMISPPPPTEVIMGAAPPSLVPAGSAVPVPVPTAPVATDAPKPPAPQR